MRSWSHYSSYPPVNAGPGGLILKTAMAAPFLHDDFKGTKIKQKLSNEAAGLRDALKKQRKAALLPENERKLRHYLAYFCQESPIRKWGITWPLPFEPDLRPLCSFLESKGFELFLPETLAKTRELVFRKWHSDSKMVQGAFGTLYPADAMDGSRQIGGVIVPLLGYDAAGNRLGYGGGFYDKFLFEHPDCFRLGYGLSAQYCEMLDVKKHDQRLDALCTEKGILRFPPRH